MSYWWSRSKNLGDHGKKFRAFFRTIEMRLPSKIGIIIWLRRVWLIKTLINGLREMKKRSKEKQLL